MANKLYFGNNGVSKNISKIYLGVNNESTLIYEASESIHIYGAEWDGSSTTSWTRTDDSALFSDPVPAVNG